MSTDKRKRKKALEHLYHDTFPKVQAYVCANKGNEAQAEDIFQDAIAIIYQNLSEEKFRRESAITSYLYAVTRNLWLQELRKKGLLTTTLAEQQLTEEYEEQVDGSMIRRVLDLLDKECRSVLINFYFYQKSMQELAQQFSLSSVQVAKTKKMRCMKKLSKIVRSEGLDQDHFII